MNILQKYIGIISYKLKFPILSGNYIVKLNNDIYNLTFDGNIRSVDYYYKVGMDGIRQTDKKYGDNCWMMLLIDKDTKELSRGSIQTLTENGIVNELNFCSPKEVKRVYRTYVDENENIICKYDYDFERFKVPFDIKKND